MAGCFFIVGGVGFWLLSVFLRVDMLMLRRLEWLAMTTMMLAIAAFIALRERCYQHELCEQIQSVRGRRALLGVPCVVLSALLYMDLSLSLYIYIYTYCIYLSIYLSIYPYVYYIYI